MFLHKIGKTQAQELPTGLKWLNSKPQSLKSLRGKVVLLDFWTYSCVNCIRTMPKLKAWHDLYADKGLVIIGIHTPEFDFEKDQKNVEAALKTFGIKYPIVLDGNYKIWNQYQNRWWPRKFLLDKTGNIVYDHVGEGGYAETEAAIQKALMDAGAEDLPAIEPDMSIGGGICYRTTPETYLGFLRGRYANVGTFIPGAESDFTDTSTHEDDVVYLHGHWKVGKESLAHTRKLATSSEYLVLKYSAFSVNLVAGSLNTKTAEVEIELDEQPLPEDMAGEDVEIIKGKAILKVKGHRMYRIIDSDAYHQGKLKLKTGANNLEMFAFTFGGCKGM